MEWGGCLILFGFCRVYNISSVEGFKRMLDVVAKENNEFNELLEKKNKASSDVFVLSTIRYIDDVVSGKITVGEMIKDNRSEDRKTLEQMIALIKNLHKDSEIARVFMQKVIDYYYYYEKLNTYDQWNELDDINDRIDINDEIARVAKMNMIVHDDGHTNV